MTFAANVGTFSTLPFSTCFVFPLAAHAVYQAFANLQKPIVGLIWSLNCRKCITSQVSAQGGFEKKLKKVFGGFWPRFWDRAATPCFIGFSGNSPLRSPCYGLFARGTISPVARRARRWRGWPRRADMSHETRDLPSVTRGIETSSARRCYHGARGARALTIGRDKCDRWDSFAKMKPLSPALTPP